MFERFKGRVTNEKWESFLSTLESALKIRGGPGIFTHQTPSGTTIRAVKQRPTRGGGGDEITGPFCKQYTDREADPARYMLTGGVVAGGSGNVAVPDIELAEVGSEPANGTRVWLAVAGDGYVEDDVLLPGFDVTGATLGMGTTFPAENDLPTASNASGTAYIPLGLWSNGVFVASGCGDILVFGCIGNLSYRRTTY